jgi:hypothetical protein
MYDQGVLCQAALVVGLLLQVAVAVAIYLATYVYHWCGFRRLWAPVGWFFSEVLDRSFEIGFHTWWLAGSAVWLSAATLLELHEVRFRNPIILAILVLVGLYGLVLWALWLTAKNKGQDRRENELAAESRNCCACP